MHRGAAGKARHHRPNPVRCPRSHRQSPLWPCGVPEFLPASTIPKPPECPPRTFNLKINTKRGGMGYRNLHTYDCDYCSTTDASVMIKPPRQLENLTRCRPRTCSQATHPINVKQILATTHYDVT